jgi:cell volume regulation protein A
MGLGTNVHLYRCAGKALVAAGIAVRVFPSLSPPAEQWVERVVTVALLCILFDGGMHLGWPRFRRSAAPIAVLGIAGTFLTAAAAAVLAHLAFGLDWYLAALLGTAVSPTDPAVVLSVLGRREVAGRSGDILEGESGANDPVGIALMVACSRRGALTRGIAGHRRPVRPAAGCGVVVGVAGGRALLWFIRRVGLPAEGVYPLRTLASVFVIYGVATLAHGSGFLAVFIAGIVLGDERAPRSNGDRTVPLSAGQPVRDRRVRGVWV